jgi:hypothetical protein
MFLNFEIKRVGARAQIEAKFVSKKNVTLFYNVWPLGDVADSESLNFRLMNDFPSTKPASN